MMLQAASAINMSVREKRDFKAGELCIFNNRFKFHVHYSLEKCGPGRENV